MFELDLAGEGNMWEIIEICLTKLLAQSCNHYRIILIQTSEVEF